MIMDNEFTVKQLRKYLNFSRFPLEKFNIIYHSCKNYTTNFLVNNEKIIMQEIIKDKNINIVCGDSSQKTWQTFLECIQLIMERFELTPDNLFPHKCQLFSPEQLLEDLNKLDKWG